MFKQVRGVMKKEEFEKHFSPPYDPWTQRLCLSPGGDFFAAIRDRLCIVAGLSNSL